jgi:hypothetical protein
MARENKVSRNEGYSPTVYFIGLQNALRNINGAYDKPTSYPLGNTGEKAPQQ